MFGRINGSVSNDGGLPRQDGRAPQGAVDATPRGLARRLGATPSSPGCRTRPASARRSSGSSRRAATPRSRSSGGGSAALARQRSSVAAQAAKFAVRRALAGPDEIKHGDLSTMLNGKIKNLAALGPEERRGESRRTALCDQYCPQHGLRRASGRPTTSSPGCRTRPRGLSQFSDAASRRAGDAGALQGQQWWLGGSPLAALAMNRRIENGVNDLIFRSLRPQRRHRQHPGSARARTCQVRPWGSSSWTLGSRPCTTELPRLPRRVRDRRAVSEGRRRRRRPPGRTAGQRDNAMARREGQRPQQSGSAARRRRLAMNPEADVTLFDFFVQKGCDPNEQRGDEVRGAHDARARELLPTVVADGCRTRPASASSPRRSAKVDDAGQPRAAGGDLERRRRAPEAVVTRRLAARRARDEPGGRRHALRLAFVQKGCDPNEQLRAPRPDESSRCARCARSNSSRPRSFPRSTRWSTSSWRRRIHEGSTRVGRDGRGLRQERMQQLIENGAKNDGVDRYGQLPIDNLLKFHPDSMAPDSSATASSRRAEKLRRASRCCTTT